ncbi:MAG: CIA30 family protein [Bacteroidota bacterium]
MRPLLVLVLIMNIQTLTLVDFNTDTNLSGWYIVDDGVMGGVSQGRFKVNAQGHGEFSGTVSLENNGGFSSIRHTFETTDASPYSKFALRIKGDGKKYQFRVKDSRYRRYSYVFSLSTNGEWQTVEVPFSEMYGSFRGYRLDIPNYKGDQMEEIAILIGNKKAEDFKLEIDRIDLK